MGQQHQSGSVFAAYAAEMAQRVGIDVQAAVDTDRENGRELGITWAKDYATPQEIRDLFAGGGLPASAFEYFGEMSSEYGADVLDHGAYWSAFEQGARDLWEAVVFAS